MKKIEKVGVVVLGLATVVLTACFPVREFQIKKGLEGYTNLHPDKAQPAGVASGGAIAIDLIVPEKTGCVLYTTTDEQEKAEKGAWRCRLLAVSTEDPKDDLKLVYKGEGSTAEPESGKKQKGGFVLNSYGETVEIALEKHLGAHFSQVAVDRVADATGQRGRVEQEGELYFQFWRTDTKRMYVTLTATPTSGGAPVSAEALVEAEMGSGHLAWMIPLAIVTFPIGYAIGVSVFGSMETAFIERVIAQAIDDAARDLSAKLAGASIGGASPGGDVAYQVGISFSFI